MLRIPYQALTVLTVLWFPSLFANTSVGFAERTEPAAAIFDSELAAVVAAVNAYNPTSIDEDREYLGAILRIGTEYSYTAAPGQRGSDRISVKLKIPSDAEVVALWHTHGSQAIERVYFSNLDTRLVRRLKKPFYLADFTGRLKIFRPGDRTMSPFRARRLGLPGRSGYAKGSFVIDDLGGAVRIRTILAAAP